MRQRFLVEFVDAGPEGDSPPERRLAGLLKTAKRLWNLRCVRAVYAEPAQTEPNGAQEGGVDADRHSADGESLVT